MFVPELITFVTR